MAPWTACWPARSCGSSRTPRRVILPAYPSRMSMLGATILTAIATLALAVFAFITAIFAWLAFRRQSQEVGLLLEQNKRDTDEHRRAQASRIFIGAPPDEGLLGPPVRPERQRLPRLQRASLVQRTQPHHRPRRPRSHHARRNALRPEQLPSRRRLNTPSSSSGTRKASTGYARPPASRQQRGRAPSDEVNAWNIWIAIGSPVRPRRTAPVVGGPH